jgi:hypothetical protein
MASDPNCISSSVLLIIDLYVTLRDSCPLVCAVNIDQLYITSRGAANV